jgi:hypothetical protein
MKAKLFMTIALMSTIIILGCEPNSEKSEPKQMEDNSESLTSNDGSQNENSSLSQEEESEPTLINNSWGCNQCSKVLYQQNEPSSEGCPVGYSYRGGSGTTHNWKDYGIQGGNYFSCEFCGLNVQVEGEPNNSDGYCNEHEYGQALTTSHNWGGK